jgi:asparagine synthase (glutamine-hydrolysing)
LNLPLQEHLYRVEEVDIDAPLGGHLPRPFGRSQSHAYERAHLEAAAAVGADGFITGNGGDNVFGYSQSAAAIADCYLCEGFGGGLLSTVRDVCRQTGCSALVAIRAAVRILRSPRPYSWRPSPTFLHPDVIRQLASAPLEHAWLDAPPGALPGKAGHIAGLLRVQPNLEPGRARYAPVLNPLLSQPIVELSLSIPSWQWRTGGRDRAIVRDAFREELPDVIVKRRSKGGPDGFTAQLIVRNRSKIAERLINGRLASKGLLDTAAIERVLRDGRPTLGEERSRLLGLLEAEAWAGHWCERLSSGARSRR